MKKLSLMAFMIGCVLLIACASPAKPMTDEQFFAATNLSNPTGTLQKSTLLKVTPQMTYAEILTLLGPTRDVGSGLHVLIYTIEDQSRLLISFADFRVAANLKGQDLADGLLPITHIRGTITELVQGKDGITFRVEGTIDQDTSYDKASVTATRETIVTRRGVNTLVALDFTEIQLGQKVEVTFKGAVAESYPVQAKAQAITILPQ